MNIHHPSFPYMGKKLEVYFNSFPVLILASQNSLQKTIRQTNHCVVSPNWFAITGQINREQHLNVLACGTMRSLLMQRMLTVKGIYFIRRKFNLFYIRILSRRHYLGLYPNHAEDLFKSGLLMCEQQNYSTAFQFWAQAALLHHGLSHAYVSNMLLGGRTNVPDNQDLAYDFALAGAKLGCQHSKGQLAYCTILYREPPKSYAEGKALEKKVLVMAKESAMTGSKFGLSAMACCYDLGFAVTKDKNEAIKLYEQAAQKGHDISQYEMGYNHLSDSEGIRWFQLAAEQGHLDSIYMVGKIDRNQRIRLWEIAAEAGHLEAQHDLGCLLLKGKNITPDYEKAERLLRLATEKGHFRAQYQLSIMFRYGIGVVRDYTEAVRLFQDAITEFSYSQYELGNMFREGLGVVRDYTEAVRLYNLAAAKGHTGAQCELGNMFRDGLGVVRDYTEAVRLYNLAAAKGHAGAQCALLNLQNL
jgi:TPR repeat protein